MILQIIFSIFLGILAGTFTGLIPGIHINLIGTFVVASSTSFFNKINSLYLITFITAMAITHTFIDFIPSIFLGCPDTDTELSILPGHNLLKQGFGYEAILLTAYGSLIAIFLIILTAIPSIFLIEKFYYFLIRFIPYFLILIAIFLIFQEKNKISASIIFFLTGFLGYCVLNFPENLLKEPLLPLLSGLFGSSTLILSIKQKTIIPEQKITQLKNKLKNFIRPTIASVFSAPLCSFLPGLGSGQAAIIGNTISKTDQKGFLFLIGATNTFVMGFSFISLYTISKTRTGATVAIQEIIGTLSQNVFYLILLITLITGVFSFFLTKILAKYLSKKINKINYTKLSIATLIFLSIIIFIFSGFFGFLVFIASTATGIYGISLKVRRVNFMGCLLIPTIIFYLF